MSPESLRQPEPKLNVLTRNLRSQADRLCTQGVIKRAELPAWLEKIEQGDVQGLVFIQAELNKIDPETPRSTGEDWNGRFYFDDPAHPLHFLSSSEQDMSESPTLSQELGAEPSEEFKIWRWQ